MFRYVAALVLVSPGILLADVYSYDCNLLPQEAGWELLQAYCGCPPEPCEGNQWIQDGQLFQDNGLCDGFEGPNFTVHRRLIEGLATSQAFFAEWRVITNGISEEFPWVVPAHIVVADGNGLVIYHFTIADDRVRMIRNLTSYFDIEPGMPHTYRLELVGVNLDELYALYIDGQIVESGVPDGPLHDPPWEPVVQFLAKAFLVPSTTTWDYIRWGDIPADGSGDFNSDGNVDEGDVFYFQECLETESGNWVACAWADFDADGDVDCDDWETFLEAWTDPGEPPAIAQCASTCPADLDGSDTVGAGDLALLLGAWGPGSFADLNGDGLVNASDLAQLLGAWGTCQ